MTARIVDSLAGIAAPYDALFCDVWGVLHNGVAPYGDAVAALEAYRAGGGKVVLITNAPRPRAAIETQLDQIGVSRESWDTIATSGDATRVALFTGAIGERVFFMGEGRDRAILEPPRIVENPYVIQTVALEEAEGVLCAGPEDPRADPASWRPDLLSAKARGLTLLCLNPDIVIDRGGVREWCAGAVARMYQEMGGEALYYGKPHPPIYDLARRRLAALGVSIPDERILAIGDGVETDVAGAMGEGLDCLFVTGGIAASETKTDRDPDRAVLQDFLNRHQTNVAYAIGQLR
ncbi:MAG: TIGR01459 family HAD-type hydrolase [Paracoccaceae bacterium]|nr:TIGR01459 family HAD-type hydrolase [Paracoccaceae bacterium]